MADRETQELETPTEKHKVVIKTYLTGLEQRAIEAVYLSSVKYETETMTTRPTFDGTIAQKAEDETIKQYVVSVDGETKDVLAAVLNMRKEDYDFVRETLQKMGGGPESKKKLPS